MNSQGVKAQGWLSSIGQPLLFSKQKIHIMNGIERIYGWAEIPLLQRSCPLSLLVIIQVLMMTVPLVRWIAVHLLLQPYHGMQGQVAFLKGISLEPVLAHHSEEGEPGACVLRLCVELWKKKWILLYFINTATFCPGTQLPSTWLFVPWSNFVDKEKFGNTVSQQLTDCPI